MSLQSINISRYGMDVAWRRVCSECVDIIYWDIMIDRVLNFGPVQQESYYFQLIPISMAMVNSSS